jgi:hypothetical protein
MILQLDIEQDHTVLNLNPGTLDLLAQVPALLSCEEHCLCLFSVKLNCIVPPSCYNCFPSALKLLADLSY